MRRTAHAQQYYQTRLNAYSLPLKAVDRIHWSSVNFSYKNWTAELWRYTIYEHTYANYRHFKQNCYYSDV